MKRIEKPIKDRLNIAYANLNSETYIATHPIKIVREMAERPNATVADIELCAIWTAMLSWGDDKSTIKHATKLMEMCEWNPSAYIKYGGFQYLSDDIAIYKTIKGKQFKEMNDNLMATYNKVSSVADYIRQHKQTVGDLIVDLSESLAPARFGSPGRNSACARINQILRWLIRKDDIDLGIWGTQWANKMDLYAVLNRHTSVLAERMGIITHKKESWFAVLELTEAYKSWNRVDPLKYDLIFTENGF